MPFQKIEFKNNLELTLRGVVHKPKKYDKAILFLHGFPGHIGGSTGTRLRAIAPKLPYLLMMFDFSGTDTSDGKFEDKLISQEVKDIKYAIDFLESNYHFKKLILIGHSTGAIDATLYAHKDKRISKLVLLGAVSDLAYAVRYDFNDRQVHDFWTKGYITYKNTDPTRKLWWVHNKKLKKAFYDEFFTLDIPAAIKRYKRPLLIVHGEKDEAIPVQKDPGELLAVANKPKKLVIIKGADHKFSQPPHFRKLLYQIYRFIES